MKTEEKDNTTINFNSVQLNIVTFVDVQKAVATQTLDGCVYMVDNSPLSCWQGTPQLESICKQGQVLNWIIYAMDADRRPDGTWPPSVRINNIVFLDQEGHDVANTNICQNLKVYGGPDKIRNTCTPVYYYWAGTVMSNLPVGEYKYRFVLELETEQPNKSIYLNMNTPSLSVISI